MGRGLLDPSPIECNTSFVLVRRSPCAVFCLCQEVFFCKWPLVASELLSGGLLLQEYIAVVRVCGLSLPEGIIWKVCAFCSGRKQPRAIMNSSLRSVVPGYGWEGGGLLDPSPVECNTSLVLVRKSPCAVFCLCQEVFFCKWPPVANVLLSGDLLL